MVMASGVRPQRQRVCVIGAGPSGIAAAKAVLDAAELDLVVYDRGSEVGGNWVFNDALGHSSVFETTHIISSKRFSQYEDFPMPADYPDYPSHKQLAAYFQAYARHFDLYRYIRFGTTVTRCEPLANDRWRVTSTRDGVESREEFEWLFICNGHHSVPRMPSYAGTFAGEMLHSHSYKRAEPFRDKRVLVIGGGNSACDVAVETSRVAVRVDLSWRRGYRIVPKFIGGVPTDYIHDFLTDKLGFIPWALRARVLELGLNILSGSNSAYGLAEPDHGFAETHPTLSSELLYFIRHGEVHPRPDIARYDGSTVHFVDGSSADFDVIVACTGFVITHSFFDRALIDFSQGAVPLYLKMVHAQHPHLFFIGLFQPLGCIWPAAELQAKLAVKRVLGFWFPPDDLPAAIEHELAHPDVQQIETPRHTISVDYPRFRKRLLRALGRDAY